MSVSKGNRESRLVCLICFALLLGTLICYWPSLSAPFVNVDDPDYVSQNAVVQNGLSWAGSAWAFKSFIGGNWNPMVWLSHMLDCQLYGLSPSGHHLTNVLLHTANVILLFLLLKSMTKAVWPSAFVAAIFGWHPMHVESVAWISERKDVLSVFFGLLTLLAWFLFTQADSKKGKKWYALAMLAFVLGLMSKSMLVTLPIILLLLDYWPLHRWNTVPPGKLLWEKLPFLALSAGASGLAIHTQHNVGAMFTAYPLPLRLENAAISYFAYLAKFFWPSGLAIFYPYSKSISPWHWQIGRAHV